MRVEITLNSNGRKIVSDVRHGHAAFGTLATYRLNTDGTASHVGPHGAEPPCGTWRAMPGAEFSHQFCHLNPCAICRVELAVRA